MIDNLKKLKDEILNIKEELPKFSSEQVRDLIWDEAKYDRKEDHCTSYILRLGRIQLLQIVEETI
jgi:hypothetical protein